MRRQLAPGVVAGKYSVIRVPVPGFVCRWINPRQLFISRETIDRPSPVPSIGPLVVK